MRRRPEDRGYLYADGRINMAEQFFNQHIDVVKGPAKKRALRRTLLSGNGLDGFVFSLEPRVAIPNIGSHSVASVSRLVVERREPINPSTPSPFIQRIILELPHHPLMAGIEQYWRNSQAQSSVQVRFGMRGRKDGTETADVCYRPNSNEPIRPEINQVISLSPSRRDDHFRPDLDGILKDLREAHSFLHQPIDLVASYIRLLELRDPDGKQTTYDSVVRDPFVYLQ